MGISRDNLKIDFLYRLAVEEGEGFGTAYEYFVKIKLLLGLLGRNSVRRILMAGFPEKYGFSLDIFFLANLCESNLLVADTDAEKLDHAERVIRALAAKKILSRDNVVFRKVNNFCDLGHLEKSDLSVSPLVVQRLSENERLEHIRLLLNISRSVIITVPNRDNDAHGRMTGLNAVSMQEVEDWKKLFLTEMSHIKYGFLDMPPFPPGVKIKKTSVDRQALWTSVGTKLLECWAAMEGWFPDSIQSRLAHMVYLFAARRIME
jgi:hypothetical protein